MILTYLRLYWITILFCGGLLGSGLAYTAWSLLPAKYESEAILLVSQSQTPIAAAGDPSRGRTEFSVYIKTLAQLIKREFVLNAALNDPKYRIPGLPTLVEQKDPIRYLQEKLVVTATESNELITIALEGDRPDDIRKIVDAVKDAFYREVVEKEINQKVAFKLKVAEAKTALEGLMKTKVGTAHPTGLVRAPATTPMPLPADPTLPLADPNIQRVAAVAVVPPGAAAVAVGESDLVKKAMFPILIQRVAQLTSDLDRYPAAIDEKKADVEAIRKQIAAQKEIPPSVEALAVAERDAEVVAKLAEAAKRTADYEYRSKVVRNPAADSVKRLKADAEAATAEAERIKWEKARNLEGLRQKTQGTALEKQLADAEKALHRLQEQERISRKQHDDARKALNEMPAEVAQAVAEKEKEPLVDPSRTDLLTHDSMYARISGQLIALDFELQSPPRVRKLQDASAPTQKDTKKQIGVTVFAGLLGFAVIGLAVVGTEMRARKVSSLGELKSSGPTPVVGVVPWQPDGSVMADPVRRADVGEAIDKLRAYVSQTWLARGASTVTVTSPLGDEGKAFAAFGLASSLAQAGYRTLLVDFDLRCPAVHVLAGVPNEAGVCELLRGEVEPKDVAMGLPNGLHFIPAGHWSDEARQAAVGGRLEALLTRLRAPFDCVILHGHALLTVAESIEIARRSEVVLLCTLYRETRLPLLRRAADRLAAMEVPYSGVVYLGATPNEALC